MIWHSVSVGVGVGCAHGYGHLGAQLSYWPIRAMFHCAGHRDRNYQLTRIPAYSGVHVGGLHAGVCVVPAFSQIS